MDRVAFVFPGQGSQYVGMGKDLYENFKVARETFEEADDVLEMKISKLCFEGPEEELRLTANTQPAILTVSVSASRVLQSETGVSPDLLAGHSLGEYAALVAGGAIEFADAVRAVRARGQFMQEAVPVGEGAIGALLGLDDAAVSGICEEAAQGEVLTPANYNCPGQIVISGHTGAVTRAIKLAKERGAKRAVLLPVSAPFHSPLMEPAARRLKEVLESITIRDLQVPVVANVDAKPNISRERIRKLLIQQISAPVRWEESVRLMISRAVRGFIELGPGRVLLGLLKRVDGTARLANVEDTESLNKTKSILEGTA
ncbi:MAG: ACP S-malonyltransferase [Deltaproteobacteria bacterium]|nr:ACP S-malonyltransferase [Deltaproteobacteria bacterium]